LEIIPKKNLCALILKSPEKEYLIMLDRKPKNFKKSDFEVQKYIENMNNEFCVFYSGNSGISTIDAAKRKINFKYFEINNDNQMRIINLLKYTNNPVKLIDIR
jgi:hypothetical protein